MNTVTKEEVLANMQDVICRTVIEFDKPATYVTVRMKNGFTLRESTTCVDPSNYNEETGKRICLQRIEERIWLLLGYALQERLAFPPKPQLPTDLPAKLSEDLIVISKHEYSHLIKRSEFLKKLEHYQDIVQANIDARAKIANDLLDKLGNKADVPIIVIHGYGEIKE